MNDHQIRERLEALCQAMTAKGLPRPEATFIVSAFVRVAITTRWAGESASSGTEYRCDFADTAAEAFTKAEASIAALPSAEQAKRDRFLAAAAKAVEIGREAGIDAEFISPLRLAMESLSKNALTHQTAHAEH